MQLHDLAFSLIKRLNWFDKVDPPPPVAENKTCFILFFQAAESGIVKIKTIAARNTDILAGKYVHYFKCFWK